MMNDLQEFHKRIEYLRSNGTKMKEIADWVGMAPSVLSSLYTTVLPAFFDSAKTMPEEEALDQALSLVNNVSKRKLLSGLEDTLNRLDELEPTVCIPKKASLSLIRSTKKSPYPPGRYPTSADCIPATAFRLHPTA